MIKGIFRLNVMLSYGIQLCIAPSVMYGIQLLTQLYGIQQRKDTAGLYGIQ